MADDITVKSSNGTHWRRQGGDYEKRPEGGRWEETTQQAFAGGNRHRESVISVDGDAVTRAYKTTSGNLMQAVETDDGLKAFKNGAETSLKSWQGGQRTIDHWTQIQLDDGTTVNVDKHVYDSYDYDGDYYATDIGGKSFEEWDAEKSLLDMIEIHEREADETEPGDFVNLGVEAEIVDNDAGVEYEFTPRTVDTQFKHRDPDLYALHWPNVVKRLAEKADDYTDVYIHSVFTEIKR